MSGQDHLPYPFAPAERQLPAMLQLQAERFGERELLRCGGESWRFAEVPGIAARMARALAATGLKRGDRIVLMCANHPGFMRLFLGAAWLGAVVVPVNTAAKGPQLGYILADSGAALLAIDADLKHALALADLPAGITVWTVGEAALPEGDPLPPAALGPGDPLAILYTSGTTGPAKGVRCPQAQYFWWGANTAAILGVGRDDVLLTTLPLFHINALNTVAQALLTGACAVVEPRFSASGFWPALARHGATVTYLLGAMVPILLSREPAPEEGSHRVRIALGPGVPGAQHAPFRERTGVALVEGYGSTETNFVIAADPADFVPGTMGRVRPGFQARVVDAEDNEMPPGEAGELALRADEPFAFALGYHGMDDRTVEAWRNLWFHTGDRVSRDAEGRFRFLDRIKDAIRRRGENISSHEVEQALMSHPAVAAAAAFPVRSELAEDEVMAAVMPKPGATLDPAELLRHCEPRLPYFALPRYLDIVDDLPRTANGKVEKFRLRERGVGPSTFDREAQRFEVRRPGRASRTD